MLPLQKPIGINDPGYINKDAIVAAIDDGGMPSNFRDQRSRLQKKGCNCSRHR